jgi:HlyD family secretion protein
MARLLQEESTLQSLQADLERARLHAKRTSMLAQDAFDHAQVDHATAERELQRSRRAYELESYSATSSRSDWRDWFVTLVGR